MFFKYNCYATKFIVNVENNFQVGDLEQLAAANQFLARHYLTLDDLDKAYTYAQKCLNYNVVR